eukprot:1568993-Prymnesium_polylepis.2
MPDAPVMLDAACSTGSFKAQAGNDESCQQCAAGYYQGAQGALSCLECPAGFFQSYPGRTDCQICPWPASSFDGSANCGICASLTVHLDTSQPPSASNCLYCPTTERDCPANTTIATTTLKPGYWRLSSMAFEAYRCEDDGSVSPNGSPCIGGSGLPDSPYCISNHTGPLCSGTIGISELTP